MNISISNYIAYFKKIAFYYITSFIIIYFITFYFNYDYEGSIVETATVMLYFVAIIYYLTFNKYCFGASPIFLILLAINKELSLLNMISQYFDLYDYYSIIRSWFYSLIAFLIAISTYFSIWKKRNKILQNNQDIIIGNAFLLFFITFISQLPDLLNTTNHYFTSLEEAGEFLIPINIILLFSQISFKKYQ